MRILLCHERFLFRFGADRVLILLGKGLAERGHTVSIMANRYDRPIVEQFAVRIVDVPEPPGRFYYLNEDTVEWLRTAWESLFDERTRPDVVIVGGWPFFAAIPFFRSVCPEVVFIDFGAVPTEGFEGGALLTQQKLRQLRSEFLPHASRIVAISDFIRRTQSAVDSGDAVPAQTILLGADHVENSLWASGQVKGAKASGQALAAIASLKAAGRKVILSLGRWETGCYKNSDEALGLLRAVREQVPSAVLAILAQADAWIPPDLRDAVHPLGFPDDADLAEVMRQSDLGVSLSRWEGFNLPLAEMQWLDRPALAYDLAAHPEVILHPWFLCSDFVEMVGKAVAILSGTGLSRDIQAQASERFHDRFRWGRMVQEYQRLITGRLDNRVHLVIDVSNSTRDPANSGVIRVTRRFGRALQRCEDPLFVVWRGDANRYVLPTREEFAQLGQFNGPLLTSEERLSPSASERVDLEQALERFGRQNPWMIFSETMMEVRFQEIRRYIRRLDLRAAAIFYDAIPVLRPDLCNEEMRDNHRDYMMGLAECDVVAPISNYSAQCLRDFWNAQGTTGCAIHADVLPGEFGGSGRVTSPPADSDEVRILCVSTPEPRKNHRRLVEACVSLKQSHPHLRWRLTLVGNRYQGAFEIADWIQAVSQEHPEVQWTGIVDDDTLQRLYGEAAFTVYPSVMEGFGLPIVESIWHGRPCICSHDGVMGELAQEGGCLAVDVQDVRALAEAIAALAQDRQLQHRLFDQAAARKLKTWDGYVEEFLGLLSATPLPVRPVVPAAAPPVESVPAHMGKTVLLCANLYPPNFVGGAELVVASHARTLQQMGHKPFVFAGRSEPGLPHYAVAHDTYEGVPVYRVQLSGDDFDLRLVNFSHSPVDREFEDLLVKCRPDVVHMHNLIGLSVGIIHAAKRHGAMTVMTLHDFWGFCLKNTLIDAHNGICEDFSRCYECQGEIIDNQRALPMRMRNDFIALQFAEVDAFISPSQFLADTYVRAGMPRHKMHVISNGLDVDRFSRIVKERASGFVRFTVISYLGEHKGVQTVLDAVTLLKERGSFRVNIVGEGHLRPMLERQVQERGLSGLVKFWGKVQHSEMETVFRETDVQILASIWPENQPVSITEAMACRTPVIATRLGGNPELVRDGQTGYLVEPGSPGDLARAMCRFLDVPESIFALGEQGFRCISENTLSNQVKRILELYEQIGSRA